MRGRRASRHLGLDLGGTFIKWVVVERDSGRSSSSFKALDNGQVETPVAAGPAAVMARLSEVGAMAIAQWPGVATVGIGVPGVYDPVAGTIRFLPNLAGAWAGQPVAGDVSRALRLPVSLINDARAFGLAELRLGAGRGASTMVGFAMGTGLGGFVAVDGHVHQGHDGTAGELGHQTIDPDGPPCSCGSNGCLEVFTRASRMAELCGAASAEEAVARARMGDQRALTGLAEIGRYLGIGIANLIVIMTPDKVVIGGGIAAATDLLLPAIQAELERRVHTTALDQVEIVAAELGTWAGAIGAAVHGAETAG